MVEYEAGTEKSPRLEELKAVMASQGSQGTCTGGALFPVSHMLYRREREFLCVYFFYCEVSI